MADKQIQDETKKIVTKWKNKRGSLIMALHEVQGAFGYVPWDAMEVVSAEMGVSMANIYAILTFYHYFKLKAPGKVIISICDGTACHIKGAPAVLAAFEEQLGIKDGGTTPDGLFHLQVVRCLGWCGLAPVVVINGKTYGRATALDVPIMIEEWRKNVEV